MRRGVMVGAAAVLACGMWSVGCASSNGSGARALDNETVSTPEAAMRTLRDGNQRYVSGRADHPAQGSARRMETSTGQAPFAVIVSCSDSRVPPEIVFDRGIGELFIIRAAGNLVDDFAMGSVEFGVAVAGAPLVVVMGHEACGAVKASMAQVDDPSNRPPGAISTLTDAIEPAVRDSRRMGGDPVEAAIEANVRRTVDQLGRSPILSEAIAAGNLEIVGARYDLDTGRVTFYD